MNAMRAVNFVHMKDGTRAEYAFLREIEIDYLRRLPDRLIAALNRLGHDDALSGYQVTRLEHCLQTATRAEDDGADSEMIVAALLHDIGDELATFNHAQLAASILRPYVRPEVTWVVEMHGLFQMQYYGHHYDTDNAGHLAFRDHPWFDACQRFCERWDQAAFDPSYPTRPLAHFEPLLREVFGKMPLQPDSAPLHTDPAPSTHRRHLP
jgi:predicted HD phosphohydrolase